MKIARGLLFAAVLGAAAEDLPVQITKVVGNAQVKREGSRKWEKAKEGKPLADNDILQTSFKSYLEIRIGRDNLLFLGSSSRALLNVLQKAGSDPEVTLTVFSGSLYSKLIGGTKFSVYTSTALARAEKSVFNSTADEVTGLSGFHVFSGAIEVSNISLKTVKSVTAGKTTTVGPGEDPSDSKKISAKQMAVLTGFYGSEFINQEIEATGVEIESEGDESYRPAVEKEAPTGGPDIFNRDRMPKSTAIFDHDLIVQRLEDHDARTRPMFAPVFPSDPLRRATYFGSIDFSAAAHAGRTFTDFYFRPGWRFEKGEVRLNLPFVSDSAAKFVVPLSGTRAVLDKIHSAELRVKNNFLRLGPLEGLTLGQGLIMEDYDNRARGDNVRDLGLFLHLEGYLTWLDLFAAGAADFRLAGLHFALRDTESYYGLSVVREADPLVTNGGDLGFRAGEAEFPSAIDPDSVKAKDPFILVEFKTSQYLFQGRPSRLEFYAAVAGLFEEGSSNLKGFGFILPGVSFIQGRSRYAIDLFTTRNRFVRGMMGRFYEDNRLLFRRDSTGTPVEAVTLGGAIAKSEFPVGVRVGYEVNPWRGIALSAQFETLLKHFDILQPDTGRSPPPRREIPGRENGRLVLKLAMGKELYGRLPWAEVYYRIDRIGYFADTGFFPFEPNPYTDFGARISYLLYEGFTVTAGYGRCYYDTDGDGTADPDESVGGFSMGAAAGF